MPSEPCATSCQRSKPPAPASASSGQVSPTTLQKTLQIIFVAVEKIMLEQHFRFFVKAALTKKFDRKLQQEQKKNILLFCERIKLKLRSNPRRAKQIS